MDWEYIRSARESGQTCQQIADHYGVSRQAVHAICAKLGVKKPAKAKEKRQPVSDEIKKLKVAYAYQKAGAKRRGIGWDLTFDQWLAWWGDDIHRRGVGSCLMQMQRIGDTGPYALWNIKKGYPRDNSRTASRAKANRQTQLAKQRDKRFRDSLISIAESNLLTSFDRNG